MRKDLINETKNELESEHVDIDLMQLKMIYQEALENIGSLNKSFSEFVAFHNQMIKNKVKYITKELPEIEEKILSLNQELTLLLEEEKKRAKSLHKSDTFSDLEDITDKLSEER